MDTKLKTEKASRHYLARNLRALMKSEDINQTEIARRTRGAIKQKTVSNILRGEHSPKMETIDTIAAVFGLKGWHLTMDYLPEDLDRLKRLTRLIDNYVASAPNGKAFIETTAERERELRPKTLQKPDIAISP
jgi:transcriptional regulator with XRE-family HTH domain